MIFRCASIIRAALAALAAGCTNLPSQLPDGGLALTVEKAEPATILPGTAVHVYGSGFVAPEQGLVLVRLEGPGLEKLIQPKRLSEQELEFSIDRDTFEMMHGPGRFIGRLVVKRDLPGLPSAEAAISVSWNLFEQLQPELLGLSLAESGVTYLGSRVEARGRGFLLGQPDEQGKPQGEGFTELRFSGNFTPQGQTTSALESRMVLSQAAFSRELLSGMLPVEAFGLEPGEFSGQVSVANLLPGGREVAGNSLSLQVTLGPGALFSVEPLSASRGQKVLITGRGFASGSAVTAVRVEGTFTHRDGRVEQLSGQDALFLFPQVLDGERMELVLRVAPDGQGGLTGLGLYPGELAGVAAPVVFWKDKQRAGLELPGGLRFSVQPQKQVVFLKYLPGFTDALRDFGLRNVEAQIRARIMEVVTRNYYEKGINVVFQETRPTEYVDYGVVEIGGVDPNGRDLLGLDATMTEQGSKDMGNVYFDDVVGGWNADSAEHGRLAYGGVFLSSFLSFSPKHPKPMPIADPLFDEIFEPFMPSRGGREVQAGEYPNGPRSDRIALAIHALGSMIGETISHEWAHTLGLAYGWGPPDVYHTTTPGPHQIMDAGAERPFQERAELNGQGPSTWTEEDYKYLREILPRD
jgi:hypothetical protein